MRTRMKSLAWVLVVSLGVLIVSAGWAAAGGEKNANKEAKARAQAERKRAERERDRDRRMQRAGGRGRFGGQWIGRRIKERLERGDALGPDEVEMLSRYLTTNLLRTDDLNTIESAHYSVAEIYLRRGDHTKCLTRLDTVIQEAGDRADEAVWLTHLNLASVCRRHLGDIQRAIREYKLVKGRWEGFAQQQLLSTFEEMGKLDEAVKILQEQYDAATEKGGKLVLLRRTAEFYERNKDEDKAIATYDRITKDFTAADIVEMKRVAAEFVRNNTDEVIELREAGQHEEAERLMRKTHRRFETMRAQGRMEEFRAMEEVMQGAKEKLEQWERQHRGKRKREHGEGGRKKPRPPEGPPVVD